VISATFCIVALSSVQRIVLLIDGDLAGGVVAPSEVARSSRRCQGNP
jgi:hypothetical protein